MVGHIFGGSRRTIATNWFQVDGHGEFRSLKMVGCNFFDYEEVLMLAFEHAEEAGVEQTSLFHPFFSNPLRLREKIAVPFIRLEKQISGNKAEAFRNVASRSARKTVAREPGDPASRAFFRTWRDRESNLLSGRETSQRNNVPRPRRGRFSERPGRLSSMKLDSANCCRN